MASTPLRRELIKAVVALGGLTAVAHFVFSAIGGLARTLGPTVVVLGAGALWGHVLRERLRCEDEDG